MYTCVYIYIYICFDRMVLMSQHVMAQYVDYICKVLFTTSCHIIAQCPLKLLVFAYVCVTTISWYSRLCNFIC